jgi:hypothetical protein
VDDQGRLVDGKVRISATLLDVTQTAQLAAAPGDFTVRSSDGKVGEVASFWIFEWFAETVDGRAVHLAPGQRAGLELPLAGVFRETAPSRARLLLFNLEDGRWVEARGLELARSGPGGPRYSGSLSSLSNGWYNTDPPLLDTTCMAFEVLEPCSFTTAVCVPAKGCWVSATPQVNTAVTGTKLSGYTNGAGRVCLVVPRNVPMIISGFCDTDQGFPSLTLTSGISANAADCNSCTTCPLTYLQLEVVTSGF